MFKWWVRWLPYALVTYIARRELERVEAVPGYESCNPFPGEILSWRAETPDPSSPFHKEMNTHG